MLKIAHVARIQGNHIARLTGFKHSITSVHFRSYSIQPTEPVRVRFAPTARGSLDLSGLRIAVLNYLLAKKTNGKSVLRIEDAVKRPSVGAVEELERTLEKLGLNFDEGPDAGGNFGPYEQSERLQIYVKYAKELLQARQAYRCFCSPARIRSLAIQAEKEGKTFRYDGKCRHISEEEVERRWNAGEPHVIRLKTPEIGNTIVHDLVRGKVSVDNEVAYDPVLITRDRFPSFVMANAIDDHLMEMTHVLRSEFYLKHTAQQLSIYNAFGWTPPKYLHLKSLEFPEETDMPVKRPKSAAQRRAITPVLPITHISTLLKNGYQPAAIVDFVANVGIATEDQKMQTMSELIENFSLDKLSMRGPGNIPISKAQLSNLNRQHMVASLDDPKEREQIISSARRIVMIHFEEQIPLAERSTLLSDDYLYKCAHAILSGGNPLSAHNLRPFFLQPDFHGTKDFFDADFRAEVLEELIATMEQDSESIVRPTNARTLVALQWALAGSRARVESLLKILTRDKILDRLKAAKNFAEENKL